MVLVKAVLDAEIDVTLSERMYVDHGFAQPLEVLLGGIDRVPVVPGVHQLRRRSRWARRAAHGCSGPRSARPPPTLDRRVLFLGSGGLSHDPPVPDPGRRRAGGRRVS